MSEPLDMEHVGVDLARQLMAEVVRLRAELARWQKIAERLDEDMGALAANAESAYGEVARQAEQITAVRKRHGSLHSPGGKWRYCTACRDDYGSALMWPCPTIEALDGTP